MALSVVTFAGNSSSANASSFAIADDAALKAGDLRFVVSTISGSNTITTPTGWTAVGSAFVLETTRRIYWFRRTHPGSTETSHTFNFSGASNYGAVQFAVRGYDSTAPIDVNPSGASAASGTTATAPSITTLGGSTLLICSFHKIANATNVVMALPSGMTNIATGAGAGSAGHAYRVAYEFRSAPGATGTRDSAVTNDSANPWGATSLAVREAPILPNLQSYIARRRAANF